MTTEIITENYDGALIAFQAGDAFVNATEMCKPFQKQPYEFLRLAETERFIAALADDNNPLRGNPVVTLNGGASRGTWLHPDLALECARWLSPKFAIWCNRVIRRILAGEPEPVQTVPKPKRPAVLKQQPVRDLLLIAKEVGKMVKGIDPALMAACTMDAIEQVTGLPVTVLRRALPNVVPEDAATLNATQVGDQLGVSARLVNTNLELLGLLTKEGDAWKITDKGTVYGEMKPFYRNGHSGYETRWKPSVVELLKNHSQS